MPCRAACQLFLGWELRVFWLVWCFFVWASRWYPFCLMGVLCLVAPEGLGGGDVLKTGGTELCDDGLGVLPNVE